jgi:hypothetical protein
VEPISQLAANTSLQAKRTTGIDSWSGNITGTGSIAKQGRCGTGIFERKRKRLYRGTATSPVEGLIYRPRFAYSDNYSRGGAAEGGEPTVASHALGSATGGPVIHQSCHFSGRINCNQLDIEVARRASTSPPPDDVEPLAPITGS